MKESIKTRYFYILLFIGFGILFSRLFWLQIVKGAYYEKLAEDNSIKVKDIPAPRGIIRDKNDEILVRNRPEGREYIYKETLAHVSGYIGEASQEEVETGKWESGDIIGKMGVEKEYDNILRGEKGEILVETDAEGKVLRELSRIEPQSGDDLSLNIDLKLQEKVYQELKEKKGAIIVSTPRGKILALASYPSFDPNVFTLKKENKEEQLENIFENKDQPLFNRSISGMYPPASTFKIVSGIAGLEEGKIDGSTVVEDQGVLRVGKWTFGNWYYRQYGKTEGDVDLVKALQRSNDIYFYKVGEWVGIENMAEWAKNFGYGQYTGIDLPGEEKGLIPTPEWKKEVKGESWYLGDSFITAIGQGDLLATPVQVNKMTMLVANDGYLCKQRLAENQKEECKPIGVNFEHLQLIKQGMKAACAEGGTGWPFFDFDPWVGCKTGTAETGGEETEPHAWFTAYAPYDNPEIVVTVLLENAGEGSSEAGPVAKEILNYWLND